MKKTFVKTILLFLALETLSGCVLYNGRNKDGSPKTKSSDTSQSDDSGSTDPDNPENKVKLYFVLGPNGLYEGAAGGNIESKWLNYACEKELVKDSLLPDASIITSKIPGSKFSHWIDRETTERVEKVPSVKDSVLVAVFTGGDGSNAYNPSGLPTEGFGFMFNEEIDGKPYFKLGEDQGEVDVYGTKYHQYQIQDFQLVKDQKFQLYDFGSDSGWTVDLDDYSCGAGGNPDKVKEYITKDGSWYTVHQTFTTNGIFIKLRYKEDKLYIGK